MTTTDIVAKSQPAISHLFLFTNLGHIYLHRRNAYTKFPEGPSLCTTFLYATAESGVMPRYNNTSGTATDFGISTSGKATVAGNYYAYPETFKSATVTSYIEKRTLGIFWSRVDIGMPNNEWVDTFSHYTCAFGHEFYLEDTGTYRATVIYEISGTGGATDVIDYEQERTYS